MNKKTKPIQSQTKPISEAKKCCCDKSPIKPQPVFVDLYIRKTLYLYKGYGLVVIATSAMSVLQKTLHAAIVTLAQTFLFSLPIAYIGSFLVGLWGVFLALPLSYLISGMMARSMLDRIVMYREESLLIDKS